MKEMTLQQVRKLIERLKERRAPHSDVCAVQVKDLDALESALLERQASAVPDGRMLVGYVWPNECDYDHLHRCLGKDGDAEIRRIPSGAVGVYAQLSATPQPLKANRCPARVIHPKPAPPGPGNPPIWCCLPEGHEGPHRHNGGGMYPSTPFRETDKVSVGSVAPQPLKAQS